MNNIIQSILKVFRKLLTYLTGYLIPYCYSDSKINFLASDFPNFRSRRSTISLKSWGIAASPSIFRQNVQFFGLKNMKLFFLPLQLKHIKLSSVLDFLFSLFDFHSLTSLFENLKEKIWQNQQNLLIFYSLFFYFKVKSVMFYKCKDITILKN